MLLRSNQAVTHPPAGSGIVLHKRNAEHRLGKLGLKVTFKPRRCSALQIMPTPAGEGRIDFRHGVWHKLPAKGKASHVIQH